MINYEEIGMRIRQARTMTKKVSQPIMAEALGMYQADISNLERARKGSGITDLAKLDAIAEYLDLPLQYLLFGTFPVNEQGKDDNAMKNADTIKKYKSLLTYETMFGNPVDMIDDDGDDYYRWLMKDMYDSIDKLNSQIDRIDYERWIPEYLESEYQKLKNKTTLIVVRFLGSDGEEYQETMAQDQVTEFLDAVAAENRVKFVGIGNATEKEHKDFIALGMFDEEYQNTSLFDTLGDAAFAGDIEYGASNKETDEGAGATQGFMDLLDGIDEELPFN